MAFSGTSIGSIIGYESRIKDNLADAAWTYAFDSVKGLSSYDVPKGAKWCYAFTQCSDLKTLSLPISIEKLNLFCYGTQVDIVIELPNLISWGGVNDHYRFNNITRILNLGKIKSVGTRELPKKSEYVVIPYTVTSANYCLYGFTLSIAILHPIAPTSGDFLINAGGSRMVYVPDESLEAYKTASNWASYIDYLHPISDYITFTDITSNLANDVVYNTSLNVYDVFESTQVAEAGAKSMIYDLDGTYDTLRISGNGGTSARLYCFVDENNEVITTADEYLNANPLYICIPSMARKMIICCSSTSSNVKVEIGKHIE
jgi:hypothetical protein